MQTARRNRYERQGVPRVHLRFAVCRCGSCRDHLRGSLRSRAPRISASPANSLFGYARAKLLQPLRLPAVPIDSEAPTHAAPPNSRSPISCKFFSNHAPEPDQMAPASDASRTRPRAPGPDLIQRQTGWSSAVSMFCGPSPSLLPASPSAVLFWRSRERDATSLAGWASPPQPSAATRKRCDRGCRDMRRNPDPGGLPDVEKDRLHP